MPTWDKSSTWLDAAINLGAANTWSAIQTFSSGIVSPSVVGGTGTTSTLTVQPTSGVGATGADIIFKVGNNGATEAMRIPNAGYVGIGGVSPLPGDGIRIVQSGSPNLNIRLGSTNTGSSDVLFQNFNGDLRIRTGGDFGGGTGTTGITVSGTNIGIGTTSPTSLLDLHTGDLTFSGANGQKYVQGRVTELVAVGSGITTKATTIQIPADAIVYAVPVRVITQPGGTATMTVTATTSGTAFQKGANISTVAGTTDPGTKNTPVNYNGTAAQTITFTFNVLTTDALGAIRVDLYYSTATPPTS